jgi:BirA family biotin operon repressor/biotin-[acetyl-CoA-carboxylase] ligase
MGIKDEILGRLLSERDFVSGQELAEKLSVSRAAVSKAVASLRDEGYDIQAVTNRGYRLASGADILSEQGIGRFVKSGFYKLNVEKSVTSTNDLAKAAAAAGAPEGTAFIAENQTAGRGRLGRKFCSPYGTGLYMSVVLRPSLAVEQSLFITTAAAAAVAKAVENVSGREAGIKWVNDVFMGGKKVCGILTEGAMDVENGRLQYAVVGIGVNVREPQGGFPEEIRDVAGAVFDGESPGDARCRIAAEILDNFYGYYVNLESRSFLPEYKRRSIVIGRDVTVLSGGGSFTAHAVDIDDTCGLVVRMPDGTEKTLTSGEVSVRL